jgi:hypothetical protein
MSRVRALSSLGYAGINLFQHVLRGHANVLEFGEIEEHLDHLVDWHRGGIEVLQRVLDDAKEAEEFGRCGHERMFARGCDNDPGCHASARTRRI